MSFRSSGIDVEVVLGTRRRTRERRVLVLRSITERQSTTSVIDFLTHLRQGTKLETERCGEISHGGTGLPFTVLVGQRDLFSTLPSRSPS